MLLFGAIIIIIIINLLDCFFLGAILHKNFIGCTAELVIIFTTLQELTVIASAKDFKYKGQWGFVEKGKGEKKKLTCT